MRVLIFGASGMLGHKLMQVSAAGFETWGTVSRGLGSLPLSLSPFKERLIGNVEARSPESVSAALLRVRPDVVVNCIGIVKQRKEAHDAYQSIAINALFPHHLAELCSIAGARLIHISTDCVFAGTSGNYREESYADADDLYGRTKFLGEIAYPHCVTLRTSIIGPELSNGLGLVAWAHSRRGEKVRGFVNARFSGLTTLELSRVIVDIAGRHRDLQGLWHVSAEPISKFDLLHLLNEYCDLGLQIEPDEDVRIDRTLDSSAFRSRTGYQPPDWRTMIAAMATDGRDSRREEC